MAIPGMLPQQQFDEFGNPIDPNAPPSAVAPGPPPVAPPPAAMVPDNTTSLTDGGDAGSGGGAILPFPVPQEQSKTIVGSDQKVASPETKRQLATATQAASDAEGARVAKSATDAAQELANRTADLNEAHGQLQSERDRSTALAGAQAQRLEQERAAQSQIAAAQADVDRQYAEQGKNYFSDKPLAVEIMAAIANAASRRNSRIMGEDPSKSGVSLILDKALENDKKQRSTAYLRSQQYLEDARKLPGRAKEAYEQFVAQLDQKRAQELRLLTTEAEVLKKSQRADPAAVENEQNVLLEKARQLDAESLVKLLQPYDRDSKHTRVDVDPAKVPAGQQAPMHPDTVLDLEGKAVGLAPPKTGEGKGSREQQAALKPILKGITRIRGLVDQTGAAERIPVAGQYTDLNKQISGEITPLLGPISQITGSGTPQEAEAKRYLENMQVSAGTNPKVAKQNAEALQRLLVNTYNAKVKSLVPNAKTTSPEAAEYQRLIKKAKDTGDNDLAADLQKEMEAL